MIKDEEPITVGAAISVRAGVASVVALLVLALAFLLYRSTASDSVYGDLVIATGPETGTYHALGQALQGILEETGRFRSVSLRTTDGSHENMRLLQRDSEIELAFVQADASPGAHARLVTALYDEVLHVLVRADAPAGISTLHDLDRLKLSLGAAGSGTRELARGILEHLDVSPAEDLIAPPAEAAEALRRGEIDALFVLAALPSGLIQELAAGGAIRFLPLGQPRGEGDEAHALELLFPGVRRQLIPRSTYGRLPTQPVSSVSVAAMLVARDALDEALVHEVTEAVFGYRAGESGLEGSVLAIARRIREDYDPANTALPYHPGAVAYYNREQPPFFVEYAEALSLGVTLLLGLYSIFVAFRELLRRRMKNRVDAYLVQIENLVADIEGLGLAELRSRRRDMEALRHAAVSDLVAERLLADDAYRIMQGHLRDEIEAIDTCIAARAEAPAATS